MIEIPNYSRYRVCESGNIWSTNHKRSGQTKILRPSTSNDGYYQTVLLRDDGQYTTIKVHAIVALAFHGPRPDKLVVNHINGIKKDNRPINLEYVTISRNCKHSFELGLQKPKSGELNGMAKLTREQVNWLRERKRTGGRFWGRNEIAKDLGMAAKHIQKIVNDYSLWPE